MIDKDTTTLKLRDERRQIVRQHLPLDVLAIHGKEVQPGTPAAAASVLIPGYGAFYGLEMDELVSAAAASSGTLKEDIEDSKTFASDIKALSQGGFVMMR